MSVDKRPTHLHLEHGGRLRYRASVHLSAQAPPRAHRLISNVLILTSGQLGQWVLSGTYLLLLSRYLGPGRYGELALAISIVTMLALIMGAGMEPFIARSIARTPEEGSSLVSSALVLRSLLGLPATLGLIAYVDLARVSPEVRLAAYILAVGTLLGQLDRVLTAVFRGRDRMAYISAASIIESAATLILAASVVVLHGSVLAFAWAITAAAAARLLVNVSLARRFVRFSFPVSRADLAALIRGSMALWANAVFLNFYFVIDSVILGALAGPRAVGFYGPPVQLLGTLLVFPVIVLTATLPLRSRLGLALTDDFYSFHRRLLALFITLSIPLGIGLVTFAGQIVGLLFGPSYQPSVAVLAVFGAGLPCAFMNLAFAEILISRDQQFRWSIIMGCSAVINPLLNLVLIPFGMDHWHNAAIGAAVALVATEVLMSVYGIVALRRLVLAPQLGRASVYSVAAGAGQFCLIWLLSGSQLLVGEIVGGLLYVAVILRLRVFPQEDFLLLRQVLLARTAGQAA